MHSPSGTSGCAGLPALERGEHVCDVLLPPGPLLLLLVLLPGGLDELLLLLPHVLFCQGVPVGLVHLLLQGGAGGQSGSSPLPQPEPLLLLLLSACLLLLPVCLPLGLQGEAGGLSGSSPLPQPEPLLLMLLHPEARQAHGCLQPLVLLSMGMPPAHQGQGCQGRAPC